MYGTEFARISGSYNTHFIGTYELLGQSSELSQSYFKLRGYFHYNANTGSVGSSGVYDGFRLDGVQLEDGNYRFYPGYTLLGEFDITVQHNEDGTFPGRSVGISAYSYHMSGSTSGNIYAPNINRLATITKANDFNDEENPYMEFTNPANFKVNLRLEFSGSIISRNGLQTPGGYTFELTDAERKLLRQKCTANTLTVRYVVATLVDGQKESLWSYVDKTMTLINANPEFNNFVFEDVNETTVALTGNNQNIIKGYSNVQVTIPVESKAIAKKETTMKNYRFTCGDKNQKEPMLYSETEPVIGTIDAVPNGIFKVFATDNRNKSTPVEKLANEVIEYSPLSKGGIDVYRNNGVSEEVKLVFDGTINNVNFGAKENSIVSALFRYKSTESGSEWSNPEKLEINVVNERFSFEGFVKGDLESKGFNISNSYEIEVVVSDELSNVVYTDTFGSGIPNLAYHKNGISVMGKYDVEVGGKFQVAGANPFPKKMATAYLAEENGYTANKNIPFDQIAGNTDLLTLSNGGIKIGKGIKYVAVSGQVFLVAGENNSYLWTSILKNSTEVSIAIDNYNTYFASTTHSPRIIGVQEGDIIYLHRKDNASGNVRGLGNTYLSVEILEEDL